MILSGFENIPYSYKTGITACGFHPFTANGSAALLCSCTYQKSSRFIKWEDADSMSMNVYMTAHIKYKAYRSTAKALQLH